MAKYYGQIGYAETVETVPGVWEEEVVEKNYFGDLTRNTRRYQSSDKLNDDLSIANELSVVSDPYALEHFHLIRYATLYGSKWKVTNVEVQFPRLILTLGGVYNG